MPKTADRRLRSSNYTLPHLKHVKGRTILTDKSSASKWYVHQKTSLWRFPNIIEYRCPCRRFRNTLNCTTEKTLIIEDGNHVSATANSRKANPPVAVTVWWWKPNWSSLWRHCRVDGTYQGECNNSSSSNSGSGTTAIREVMTQ